MICYKGKKKGGEPKTRGALYGRRPLDAILRVQSLEVLALLDDRE